MSVVGITRMIMKKTISLLAVTAAGCALAGELLVSAWSEPCNGLKMQISSPASFPRKSGIAEFEVTCTIMNVSNSPTSVSHLARLYLVDKAGVTNACGRHEDVMDMTPARPTIATGQTTSWKQDGQLKTDAGSYRLIAVWDRDKNIKSPTIDITVK